MNCPKCKGTGLINHPEFFLSWCDCATGRVVWQAALDRALDEIATEMTS
jgi:hypothetical protein